MAKTLADRTLLTRHERTRGFLTWLEEELRRPSLYADQLDDTLVAKYAAWRTGRILGKGRRPAGAVMARKDLKQLISVYAWALF